MTKLITCWRQMDMSLQVLCVLAGAAFLGTSCATGTSHRVSDPCPAAERLQAGGSIEAEIDALVRPLVERSEIYGVAVGVVTGDGHSHVCGYGRTDHLNIDRLPAGDTIFQLGSVSKVFIAALLAVLVDEGVLDYEDSVRSILPADVPVRPEVGKLTLYELATHTAGFPREPISIRQLQNFIAYAFTGHDVYAHITKPFLYSYLRTCHIKRKEKRRYEYSNIGCGLLAHLIEVKTGRRLSQLLEEKICRPLNMRDTTFILTAEQERRLAIGHAGSQPRFMRRGSRIMPWNTGEIMRPCACLYSTVNDLMIFTQASLGMLHHRLEPVLASTLRTQLNGTTADVALGWQIDYVGKQRVKIIFKYGVISGYHGYVGMNPNDRIAVVVLCNTFSLEDEIGHNLLLRLSERPCRVAGRITESFLAPPKPSANASGGPS
jgi:CubicO group peptidase (beta-lactamase class C family)